MTDIRVDLETATRDELVAEIVRLHEVDQRWANGWKQIMDGCREGWQGQVAEQQRRADMFQDLLNQALAEIDQLRNGT